MKAISAPLLLSTMALAAGYSGNVIDFTGAPIAGAVVKTAFDSTRSATDGTWHLDRAQGLRPRTHRTISVASHLSVEQGRARIQFSGFDAAGRGSASAATQALQPASRSLDTVVGDTLAVLWNGKRLFLLPVPADSQSIQTKIDTGWADDHGHPWNPAFPWGSLRDPRDGYVYRTTRSLDNPREWLAENLQFLPRGPSDTFWCESRSAPNPGGPGWVKSFCEELGPWYPWATAVQDTAAARKGNVRGICPIGWRVPRTSDWSDWISANRIDLTLETDRTAELWPGIHYTSDHTGFRALIKYIWSYSDENYSAWWTSDPTPFPSYSYIAETELWQSDVYHNANKGEGVGIRCVKDTL